LSAQRLERKKDTFISHDNLVGRGIAFKSDTNGFPYDAKSGDGKCRSWCEQAYHLNKELHGISLLYCLKKKDDEPDCQHSLELLVVGVKSSLPSLIWAASQSCHIMLVAEKPRLATMAFPHHPRPLHSKKENLHVRLQQASTESWLEGGPWWQGMLMYQKDYH